MPSPFGDGYWRWKLGVESEGFEILALVVKTDHDGGGGGKWGPGEVVFMEGSQAVARKANFFFDGLLLSSVNVVSMRDEGGVEQASPINCFVLFVNCDI